MINEVLALLREKMPSVRFDEAYSATPRSHLIDEIIVTVEVASESHSTDIDEIKLAFNIYLAGQNLGEAEKIFAGICAALREDYSSIKSVARGSVKADSKTGALIQPCYVTFESVLNGEITVRINGAEYDVGNIKTSFASNTRSLTSFGEDAAFASIEESRTYTVTLIGIDTALLAKLNGFTVEISGENASGSGIIYTNCAWKSISEADKTAVFISGERR